MRKVIFLIFILPAFCYGQGKYHGGEKSGYSSTFLIIEKEPPILSIAKEIKKIFLYPNPTFSFLYLGKTINSSATIIDALGRTVSIINRGATCINVSHYPQGIYFLKTENKLYQFVKK